MKLFQKIVDPLGSLSLRMRTPYMTMVQVEHVCDNLSGRRQAFGTQQSTATHSFIDDSLNHFRITLSRNPLDFTGEEENPSRNSECLNGPQ
jgi:hypothetical protein